ncbi:hypothetical protein, partial [Phocaeicola vulgatus]|uniref:hypothetical protein n=1 Tax=Phocaeicola vulgatus TaxID=821 RepID=UPI003219B082
VTGASTVVWMYICGRYSNTAVDPFLSLQVHGLLYFVFCLFVSFQLKAPKRILRGTTIIY